MPDIDTIRQAKINAMNIASGNITKNLVNATRLLDVYFNGSDSAVQNSVMIQLSSAEHSLIQMHKIANELGIIPK